MVLSMDSHVTHADSPTGQSAAAEGRLTSSSPPTGNSTSFDFFNSRPREEGVVLLVVSRLASPCCCCFVFPGLSQHFFFLRPPSFFFFSDHQLPPPLHVLSEPRPCVSNWRYQNLRPVNISFNSTSAVFISGGFFVVLALGAGSFCDSVSRLSRLRFHITPIRQHCSL